MTLKTLHTPGGDFYVLHVCQALCVKTVYEKYELPPLRKQTIKTIW